MFQRRDARSRHRFLKFALALALTLVPIRVYSAYQAAAVPDLPQITVEQFPAGVREEVEKAYRAVKANPSDPTLNGNLGMVLEAQELADSRAEICYRRAHMLDPPSFRWAYYLGLVLAGEGKYNEAVLVLNNALRVNPGYLPARLSLGECLLALARWQEADQLFEALAKEDPNNPHAHFGLARVRAARNDLNGAAESFRRACELFPSFSAAHYGLARVYERLGDKEQSSKELSLYASSRGQEPGMDDPLLGQVLALRAPPADLRLAEELEAQGKLGEAAAEFEKALAANSSLEKVHVKLISLYGLLGQAEKAEEHFQRAIALNPNNPDSYFNHGLLLASEDKFVEAEVSFRKVLEMTPRYSEGHTHVGYMLEAEGKLAEAEGEYEKAIADVPGDARAHFALGRIAVNQDRYPEGIRHFLICVRTGSDDERATYLYALGAAYARAGDRDNALQYLRQAHEAAAARGQATLKEAIDADIKQLGSDPGP